MDPGSFKEVINLNLTKLELVLAYGKLDDPSPPSPNQGSENVGFGILAVQVDLRRKVGCSRL